MPISLAEIVIPEGKSIGDKQRLILFRVAIYQTEHLSLSKYITLSALTTSHDYAKNMGSVSCRMLGVANLPSGKFSSNDFS